jgi:hypothetical protein
MPKDAQDNGRLQQIHQEQIKTAWKNWCILGCVKASAFAVGVAAVFEDTVAP